MAVLVDWASDGWVYKTVASGAEPNFYEVDYNESGWSVGKAAFGRYGGNPDHQDYTDINTVWDSFSDLLLRKRFMGQSPFTIVGRVDDNMTVYLDEANLGTFNIDVSGFPPYSVRNVNPDWVASYVEGTTHTLAVRIVQATFSTSAYQNPQYADLQVTGTEVLGDPRLRLRQVTR